jgi:predicted O-methyltransferase YrrM
LKTLPNIILIVGIVNLYSARKYLTYILFSSHRKGHGIHGPFLFNLITKVFRNKVSSDDMMKIEEIRRRMLSDRRILTVTDYGSGNDRRGGALRKVSEIARNTPVTEKYGKLLANLSREFGRECIVELGTSLGIGAMYLAAGTSGAAVHTIEGCPLISEVASENFKLSGYNNIILYTGTFRAVLDKFREQNIVPGLVFIDGDHRGESMVEYFEKLCSLSDERTVMVFDDIYRTAETGEAWSKIKSDKRVTLSLDIFRMGLVFLRKGLTPAAFIIRY